MVTSTFDKLTREKNGKKAGKKREKLGNDTGIKMCYNSSMDTWVLRTTVPNILIFLLLRGTSRLMEKSLFTLALTFDPVLAKISKRIQRNKKETKKGTTSEFNVL